MLAKPRRIRSARDHREMWRSGRMLRGKYMVIRYRLRPSDESRFGFVVSSAIAKKAVARNTIKRRLRNAVQQQGLKGVDAVVYATKNAVKATYQDLRLELQGLLTQTRAHEKSSHYSH